MEKKDEWEIKKSVVEYLKANVEDKVELLVAQFVEHSVRRIFLEATKQALQEFLAQSLVDDIADKVAVKVAAADAKLKAGGHFQ